MDASEVDRHFPGMCGQSVKDISWAGPDELRRLDRCTHWTYDADDAGARRAPPAGLVWMADVINCSLISLVGLVSALTLQEALGSQVERGITGLSDAPNDVLADDARARLKGWFERIGQDVTESYELLPARHRVERFMKVLAKPDATNRDVHYEIRALREAVDDGIRGQLLYRYPRIKAEVLLAWQSDWAAVIVAFPETEADVLAGVDLWALGHGTASVFHMMRVLETGLRALARDLGLEFTVQNWQNIINEIEAAIRAEQKSLPRGEVRLARLQFHGELAKEFTYFKDGWRNHVSHGRSTYDEHQARSLMEHVRQFMTTLASRTCD